MNRDIADGLSWLGFGVRLLFTAGWTFGVAAAFAITWIAPFTFGETTVHKLTFLMLVEFLVVHSTGFFTALGSSDGPQRPWWKEPSRFALWTGAHRRGLAFAGLMLFYLLFAWAFSVSYGGHWPIYAFLAVSLPKLPGILFRPTDFDGTFSAMANWAAMTALYLLGCFATLMYDVPRLGVTDNVIARQGFSVGGIWPEEPYRVLAFGVLYFTGLSLLSLVTESVGFLKQRKASSSK